MIDYWKYKEKFDDLEPEVKEKALELIAGLSERKGADEQQIISDAIKKAKEWYYESEG